MERTTGVIAGVALTACLFLAGCLLPSAGPMVTDSRSIKQGGAKSVDVQLNLAVGDLTLSGGAADLMNAEFRYNIPAWKPEVNYSVNGTQGTLTIRQPRVSNLPFRNAENHWDVHLRDVLPMDLAVRSDTGDSDLHLIGLEVSSLTLDSDTGDVRVDLAGRYASLGSVGLKSDTGDCRLRMTGVYPSLTSLKMETDTGDLDADLSGSWEKGVSGEITCDTGDISVVLPSKVGVYVTTHTDTGDVSANGLIVQGKGYTNAAYGKSPVTLRLDVHTDTGDITLR